MRRRHHILPIAFAASLLGGCLGSFGTPGGGQTQDPGSTTMTGGGGATSGGNGAQSGGGDGTTTPTPTPDPTPTPMPPAVQGSFAAALDKSTDTIRLNETKSYTLTLTPSGGLTGGVTLSLDNPPAGVSAKFTPATVNITDATPVTVKVDVTVAPDQATPTTTASLAIKAVSGSVNASAMLGLTIPAELLIQIAKGVAIGSAGAPNTTAFSGVSTMTVKYTAGMKISFVNMDGINHEIHAQGSANTAGIAHEGGPLMANSANTYTQTINGPGTINANDLHCHIHPNMIGPKIIFQ